MARHSVYIQLYYENGRSTKNVYRALRATYGPDNQSTNAQFAIGTIDKFETQFAIMDNTRPHRPHPPSTSSPFSTGSW